MDLEPALKELRAAHGPDLDSARQKLAWFFVRLDGRAPALHRALLAIRACGRGTCLSRSGFRSGINGWPVWTQAMEDVGVEATLRARLNEIVFFQNRGLDAEPVTTFVPQKPGWRV